MLTGCLFNTKGDVFGLGYGGATLREIKRPNIHRALHVCKAELLNALSYFFQEHAGLIRPYSHFTLKKLRQKAVRELGPRLAVGGAVT